jgi:hypothetical protein
MKTLHSAILLSCVLLPGYASANLAETTESCRIKTAEEMDKSLQQHRPKVYEMYSRTPDDLCAFSAMAKGIDNSRCKSAVKELHDLLDRRKARRADRCVEKQDLDAYNQRCAGNLAAKSCLDQGSNVRKRFREGNAKWKGHQSRLAQATEKVEQEMVQLSQEYKDNMTAIKQDMQQGLKTSPAACKVGDCNPSSAYAGLGGDSAMSEISRALETIQNKSEISQSDIEDIQSMRHAPASETLYLAASAKSASLEMKKDNAREDSRDGVEAGNINKVDSTSAKLSDADPAASQSAIGGTPVADASAGAGIGGLGGIGGGGGAPVSGSSADSGSLMANNIGGGNTFVPGGGNTAGNQMLNGVANNAVGAKDVGIEQVASAEQATGDGAATNGTGASRMSVKDALRAKLAGQLAQGKGGATGASQAGAAKAGGLDAKLKEKAGANPEMLAGFAPTDFGAAGGGNFSMPQSETDAAVKEMMSEFEGNLGGEGGFGGARHLASVADDRSAPEILAADSSDLFLRTKTFYERCQKRGCVTR